MLPVKGIQNHHDLNWANHRSFHQTLPNQNPIYVQRNTFWLRPCNFPFLESSYFTFWAVQGCICKALHFCLNLHYVFVPILHYFNTESEANLSMHHNGWESKLHDDTCAIFHFWQKSRFEASKLGLKLGWCVTHNCLCFQGSKLDSKGPSNQTMAAQTLLHLLPLNNKAKISKRCLLKHCKDGRNVQNGTGFGQKWSSSSNCTSMNRILGQEIGGYGCEKLQRQKKQCIWALCWGRGWDRDEWRQRCMVICSWL